MCIRDSDKAHQAPIPIVQEQGLKVVKFFKNMRNGSHIVEDSYKLHDGIIEKGTTGGAEKTFKIKVEHRKGGKEKI